MKLKVISTVIAVIVFSGVAYGLVLLTKPAKKASAFPVGSSLAVAKQHSQGTLPVCLAKNTTAEAAVRKNDVVTTDSYGSASAFDMATTMGIDNVPAGTNVDEFIHSYDGKTVTGSIAYPPKYGTYNFVIVPSSKAKPSTQWTMTSIIACQKAS